MTPAHATRPASGEVARASARSAPGDVIAGRYRLIDLLGQGGAGEVWLAEHLLLRARLALKLLKPSTLEDPESAAEARERFRFEAQVSALLGKRTRHVVSVQDAGESEVGPYLAMEHVAGWTLADEIDGSGPLPPERVALILDQASEAIDAAHAAGIVHRDVKPPNLLLACDGGSTVIKVADFGLAKCGSTELALDRPRDTVETVLVGTPEYLSPEQLASGGELDPRSDLWALAVVAYEAVTGRPPFQGKSMSETMVAIVRGSFAAPSTLRGELPAALDRWFDRALAKDPARRFGSAGEAAAAFRGALDPPDAAVEAPPPRPRAPGIAVTLVALVAGATVAIGALGWSAPAPAAAPRQPQARGDRVTDRVIPGAEPPTATAAPRAPAVPASAEAPAAAPAGAPGAAPSSTAASPARARPPRRRRDPGGVL